MSCQECLGGHALATGQLNFRESYDSTATGYGQTF
jgi:hypothetical protein